MGLIADATGNIRFAFFFLVFMMLIPIPILLTKVDVDQGREDARAYVRQREDWEDAHGSREDYERLVSGSEYEA